eukprot:CAMPEP_0178909300 /NCGR_PEP_ID=MMETSP0786-20121207/8428_1 /TAXON_ID=186022 /ORGANISM="Thalassionema frauenfeldii, Strain CCMP 1798" /LENGTH=301 /DNA_ID=CAMNT_0020581351 /DNA_START=263 /DNA_END=1165 /DNA_ORIENTATION=+
MANKNDIDFDESKVKIVGFIDKNFAPVGKWWYQRMTNLSYTTHTLVLIDQKVVDHFTEINNSSSSEYYRFEVRLVDEGNRRKQKIRNLWYHRIKYCLEQLEAGESILLTDVDNIFQRYVPLSEFYNSPYDTIYALEQKFPTLVKEQMGFVVCGGMTFLKSTPGTIAVVKQWLWHCTKTHEPDMKKARCDDQVQLNLLLVKSMTWNNENASRPENLNYDDLIQYGFDGYHINPNISFHAKVWDRDFAWRGDFDTHITCPSRENNWVSMPTTLPKWTRDQLTEINPRINHNVAMEKMSRVAVW